MLNDQTLGRNLKSVNEHVFKITFPDKKTVTIVVTKLPKGATVGDRVTVTLRVTLERGCRFKRWPFFGIKP